MIPEAILKAVISYGALGVCLAVFIWLYISEKTAHAQARTVHAAELKKIYETHSALERALMEQINDLREAHAVRERACLQTVEYFAKTLVQAVEELTRIADVLRRHYAREPR